MPKIIPGYKPSKKKEIPWRSIFLFILLLGFIAGIIYLFIFSPIFKIKTIEMGRIVGANREDILNLINEDTLGKNIFLWQKNALEKEILAKDPLILNILVFKGLPSTLRIVFQETSAQISWQTQSKNYVIDERGRVLKEEENNKLVKVVDAKNLEIKPGEKIIPSTFINFVKDFYSEAYSAGIKITYFEVNESLFDLNAYTDKGLKLIINCNRSPSDMIDQYLKAIGKISPQEYVDLRFAHRVFIK